MKMRDAPDRFVVAIWPIKPPDVVTVLAIAVVVSTFGYGADSADARWAEWWAGIAFGLGLVLMRVVRRVRRRDQAEQQPRPVERTST